jgi:hypothetical protein
MPSTKYLHEVNSSKKQKKIKQKEENIAGRKELNYFLEEEDVFNRSAYSLGQI